MKKHFALFVLALVGIVSIIATSPPPNFFTIITANDNASDRYYGPNNTQVFACLNEKVIVDWFVSSPGTLTATPSGQLNPDLTNKQVESSGTFETEVLGDVTVALTSESQKREVALGLIPETVCKGFPINLIADFSGTLQQTLPEVTMLERTLTLRWRSNALQATVMGTLNTQDYESVPCQLFPDEDKLICSAGDETNPRFRLEGIVTAEGFTGTYKGFDESTAGNVSFEGTFDFKKVEPPAQPQ